MKRKIIPYDSKLKPLSRELRNRSTLGEVLLWKKLKGKQFGGYDFHRQKPLLQFIVDFYCAELALVIEIDGNSHHRLDVAEKDARKTSQLKDEGLQVLRFTESQVRFQMQDVCRQLEDYVRWYEEAGSIPSQRGVGPAKGGGRGVLFREESFPPNTPQDSLRFPLRESQATLSPPRLRVASAERGPEGMKHM